MNEKLIEVLKLPTNSGENAIINAVIGLVADNAKLKEENEELLAAPPETDQTKLEKRIVKKIAESGGALNREQATLAITHQDEAAAAQAKKKAGKK